MPLNKDNKNDINRLKDEAIKRANEAHKQAVEKREQEKQDLTTEKLKQQPEITQPSNSINIFDSLMKDQERTLILILILLLVDEGADMGLILALMYIII